MSNLYIFDTDISLGTPLAEIDDGAALICLRRALGDRVLAVTTVHGNIGVAEVTWNAQRLCAALDWEVPIFRGAEKPLLQDPDWFADWQAGYGETEQWPGPPQPKHAANAIVDLVRQHPGRVSLVAVGPLTNLALALRLAPEIEGLVKEVVCMGGGFKEDHAREFNARCDPEAAAIVLGAAWPLRLFGLEITRQVFFSREDFEELPEMGAAGVLKAQAPGWIDRVEAQGWETGGCSLHDAAPVAALVEDDLFAFSEAEVSVELADPAMRGLTRATPGEGTGPTARVRLRVADEIRAPDVVNLVPGLLEAA